MPERCSQVLMSVDLDQCMIPEYGEIHTRSQLINKANVVLLGDDGYGIEPCLMTPFRNPTPGAEINYNKLLKQERVIIERCFGQLKCRFPILQYVCRAKWENVPKISIACIVLHNAVKSLGDPDFELSS
ncbi:unnamed protein product [Acanthoscelides obtectus]|uniref:DDE Tnp4 domain-containing protein n=1 Tax=Acanthoscelides obtectus TaxID=200917 RepID=A0A9P0KQU5_ACAOB|nr:unnamed protein product [Acanthoscelides obtectus]CAK1671689.1 hypothetical protein AOBTE_LOCUS28402 [Acanthoscelides obtectus]